MNLHPRIGVQMRQRQIFVIGESIGDDVRRAGLSCSNLNGTEGLSRSIFPNLSMNDNASC